MRNNDKWPILHSRYRKDLRSMSGVPSQALVSEWSGWKDGPHSSLRGDVYPWPLRCNRVHLTGIFFMVAFQLEVSVGTAKRIVGYRAWLTRILITVVAWWRGMSNPWRLSRRVVREPEVVQGNCSPGGLSDSGNLTSI